MFYLADIARKNLLEGTAVRGETEALLFDNISHKCAVQTDNGIFVAEKLTVGQNVNAVNLVALDNAYTDDTIAINPFGALFVGQPVYDTNGKFYGAVENAEITAKLVLKKFWVGDVEFQRNQIYSVGDAILIKAKSPKQLLLQQAKANKTKQNNAKKPSRTGDIEVLEQTTPHTAAEQMPQAAAENSKHITTQAATEQAPQTAGQAPTAAPNTEQQGISPTAVANLRTVDAQYIQPPIKIRKKYGNFNFLVGKTVDKTITNFQGEVMIKQADTVTKDILRQAKISGKLIELYLHVE